MSPLVVVLTCLVIVIAAAFGMATIDLFFGNSLVLSLARASATVTGAVASALKKVRDTFPS